MNQSITLKEVIKGLAPIQMIGKINENAVVHGVSQDSREIEPGDIFVAIRGRELDGESFAASALSRGALCVITEHPIRFAEQHPQKYEDAVQIIVRDAREALAIISTMYWGYPADSLYIIGITGSNGKTSTTFMLDEILKAAEIRNGLIGTVQARTGKSNTASIYTTPLPPTLHRYFREMVESGFTDCAMEVSSLAIAMKRVWGLRFDLLGFINISREHIDDHGTFEDYFGTKASIVRGLDERATVVLNADQPLISMLAKETKANVLFFSVEDPEADCYVEYIDLSTGFGKFTLKLKNQRIDIQMKVAGYHTVINAAAAAAVAFARGIAPEMIKKGLEQFSGVERRFQCVYDKGFKIFDDHFANPGNIDVTFETLHRMDFNACRVCYAVRGMRGVTVNRESAETSVKHLKKLGITEIIATSSVDSVDHKDEVTPEEKAVFYEVVQQAGIQIEWYDKLADAVIRGIEQTKDGDILLLAGCQGMDSGAHIALHYLAAKTGDSSITQPIINRVCGELPKGFEEHLPLYLHQKN